MSNRGNMPVPPRWSGQDRRFGETVKNNLDVLCGYAGSPLDRAITARDLLDSGIATVAGGSNIFSGESTGLAPVTNDLTYDTPPAPTNFTVSGAYQNILLTWTVPDYNGHSYTEVYRHTADSIANATLVGQSSSFVGLFTDAVGGGQTYYYWIRVVNQNGVAGPFNSSTGTLGQTAVDVTHILSVLSDAITEDQLATALQGEIDKISGAATLSGSVAARIATEAAVRVEAVSAEATARATAVSGEATARATAVSAEATARATAITTAVSAEAVLRAAAITTEAASRASAITTAVDSEAASRASAISTAADSLQSQLNDLTGIAAWDSSTSYAIGDNVRHDDKLWAAAAANSDSEPTYSNNASTNSDWTLTGDYTSLASVTSANSSAITAINNVSTNSTSAAAVAIKNLQSGKEDTGVAASAISALTTTIGETYATAANLTALETAVFNDMTGVADWVGADATVTPPITAVTYAVGDKVVHNKKLYRATDASTDEEPPNTTYWALDTISYSSAISDLSTTLTEDYATSSATTLLLAQKENSGAAAQALIDSKAYSDLNFATASDFSVLETAVFNDMTGVADWNSTTNYAVGDRVISGQKLYRASDVSLDVEPPNASYWVLDTLSYSSAISDLSTTLTEDYATASATTLLLSQKENSGAAAQALSDSKAYSDENFASSLDLTAIETAVFNDMTGVADWNSATAYAIGDKVISGKKLYRASAASTDSVPPNASYWVVDTLSSASAVSQLSTTLTQDYATSSATNLLLAQKENSGAAAQALSDSKAYSDLNFATASDFDSLETAVFNDMTGVADWNSETTYAIGARVISGKKLYRATVASTNQVPPDASYWVLDTLSYASTVSELSTTLTTDYATATATNLLLADKEDSGAAALALEDAQAYADENFATSSNLTNLESATFGNLTGLSAYDESTTYAIGDRVTHGTGAAKKIYIAIQASSSSNQQAPTVTTFWNEDTIASQAVTNAALGGKETSGAAAQALEDSKTYADENSASAIDFSALNAAVFEDVAGVNAWNSATAYAIGARVYFGRKIYRAVATSTNVEPGTNTTKWLTDPAAAASALTALDTKVTEDYATSQSVTEGLALKINSSQSATNISQAIDVSEQTAGETYATATNLSTLESSIFNNVINAPDWDESTAYAVGTYVNFEQKIYKALLVNTNVEPDTDATKWQVDTLTTADQVAETYATNTDVTVLRSNMFNNMTGVADWNDSTDYVAGSRVVHTESNGVAKLYKCLVANSNTTPHDNISGTEPKWELDTIASALALSSLQTTVTEDYSTTVTVNGQLAGKESAGTAAGLLESYTTTADQNTATATAVDAAYVAIFDEMTGLPSWNDVSVYEIGDRVVHRSSSTDNRKVYKALIAGSNAAPHDNLTGATPKWELDTLAFAGALSTLDAQVNTSGTGLVSKVDGIELRIDNVGGVTMEQKFTAQATDIGDLESQYTVKIDANGSVAGFGLANTTTAAGESASRFYVNADRFAILPNQASSVTPDWAGGQTYASGEQVIHDGSIYISKFEHVSSSSSPPPSNYWTNGTAVPFVVQQTGQTINGAYVPAGVYMDTAYIKRADISSAQIGSVNADTITTGTLDVTNRINADAINATKLNLNGSSLSSVDVDGVPTLQIDDAAITTAKINDLAVETIKIKDQAVTIPSHVFVAGPKLVGTTEVTLCEEIYVSSGAPALIMFTCGTEAYFYNCDRYFAAKLYKNGVYVRTFSGGKVKSNSNVSFNSVNFVYQETDTNPGAITKYTVKGFGSTWGSGSAIFNDNSLFILETKK